jgi:DNA repair protein RadC
MAAFELGRRLASLPGEDKPRIGSSEDVSNLMMPTMRDLLNEALHVLCLDTKNYVTKQDRIFEGSLNASVIHPREVFRFAIREAAASIILVHNHPSGDPTPSSDDIRATKQIVEAGKYIEIPVLDHVIIGSGRFVSLKEKELI